MLAHTDTPEYVVMNGEYPQLCEAMGKYVKVVKTQPNPYLPYCLRYHADMQFIDFGDNVYIIPGSEYLEKLFLSLNKKVNYTEKTDLNYPDDVRCNAKYIGNSLLCNKKTISPRILTYCENNNIITLSVRQGYTGCSTLYVPDNIIISNDIKIVERCRQNKMNSFYADNHDIFLKGYDCGFIGGSSGSFNDKVFFTGSVAANQYYEFTSYLVNNKIEIIELNPGRLIDIGGIIPIFNNNTRKGV